MSNKSRVTRETRRARLLRFWRKELLPLLVLAAVLFSLRSSLADWNDVPSSSMFPTILVGDRILVNKVAYDLKVPFTTLHLARWDNPARGDVVVFYSPHDGTRLVKRVIALPGDIIELQDNRLILNHQQVDYAPLPDDLVNGLSSSDSNRQLFATESLPDRPHPIAVMPFMRAPRTIAPFRVPEGHYFMMGDNRDVSFDSRFFGCVPRDQIIGRAEAVVFSLNHDNWWLPRLNRWCKEL